jgi:hypothetical protein
MSHRLQLLTHLHLTNHGLLVGDAVIPRTTANGLTAGVKYWVVGTVKQIHSN